MIGSPAGSRQRANPVRRRKRRGELPQHDEDAIERQTLSLDRRGERFALDVLHHEKRPALVFDDVVDDGDVRMRHTRRRARLVEHARLQFGPCRELVTKFDLQSPVFS